jgi:hypothetical protein
MNVDMTAYLVFILCSAALCCALYALSAKAQLKVPAGKAAALGGLTLVLGAFLGLAGAKLLYFLFRFTYLLKTGFFAWLFSLDQNELSYYGGAAGVCLGAALAARILKVKPGKALNVFAASGALLAALFRFAEYWLGALGTGDYLEMGLPFPFAVSEVWNPDFPEYYLAVFMLEGIVYLRIALFAFRNRKDRLCFLRTVFYLCIAQIILESMRAQSIRWLFVRYEQLLCYLIAEGILIWYAFAGKKAGKRNWGAALWGLIVCGLTVLAEYMLDGKISFGGADLPPVVIYAFMAWMLLELTVAEHAARKKLPDESEVKA